MHIGMIVGVGPAATDFYYRYLIAALARAGKDLDLSMAHADTGALLKNQAKNDVGSQVEIYARLGNRLRSAGAQALAITSIAGHFCVNEFKRISPLPIIDLLHEVRTEVGRRGLTRLGLIGTRHVMMSRFYDAMLTKRAIYERDRALPPHDRARDHTPAARLVDQNLKPLPRRTRRATKDSLYSGQ